MKKTLFKLGFIFLCVGIIIFLLLPFLETTPPATTTLKSSQPQIISSNPLAVIAKRLASLFERKQERTRRLAGQPNNTPENSAQTTRYAALPISAEQPANFTTFPDMPSQTVQVPYADRPFDYADASFQTDQGEWVLVRQTAPQSSSPGMHEVNVHDNPYDRYIRQERARHFGPQVAKEEIPHSKWARLTQPLKTFLGITDPQPVQPSPIHVQHTQDKASALRSAQDKLAYANSPSASSFPQMRMQLPAITPQQWAALTEPERENLQERVAAHNFAQLMSGEYAARQAAEILGQAKYPFPKNEQEEKEKEEYIQRLTEENKQQIKEALMANIEKDAAQSEPVDMLSSMTGCKDSSLPSSNEQCTPQPPQQQHTPAQILEKASDQNAKNFFEKTKFVLPEDLPFTVVLGPTDPATFEQMQPFAGEIYKFLAQQKKCDSQTCFWVPNAKQSDPSLKDAITTVGKAKLHEDPFNTYDSLEEDFKDYKVQLAGKNITPEQIKQIEKQAQKQWEKYRPNWTPWAEEDLVQLNQNNLEALSAPLDKPSDKNPIFPLIMDANTAVEVSQLIGPNFVYNKTPQQLNSPIEAGTTFTDSIADEVNDAKNTAQQLMQKEYQQAVNMNLGSLYNQAATQNNQSGGGFQGLLNAIKGFRDRSFKK